MAYVLSGADANVRDIAISADLTICYYETYIGSNYYTSVDIYTKAYICHNFYNETYITSNYYGRGSIDSMYEGLATSVSLGYYTQPYINYNFYNKTETDNLLANKLSVSCDTTDSFVTKVPIQHSFNTTFKLENTTCTYCSLFLNGSGVDGQIYVGGNIKKIRTNTSTKMTF